MGKTKAEEREALVKIGQILEDFSPEDTYIGKAFEGCVEQADENLRNDWMMSYKDRYDRVSEQFHAANARIMDVTRQLNQKDDAIARLTDAKNQLSEEIGRLDGVIAQRDNNRQELLGKLSDAKEEVEDLKLTVVRLKAKLYDMMTAGEEVKG